MSVLCLVFGKADRIYQQLPLQYKEAQWTETDSVGNEEPSKVDSSSSKLHML